MTKDIIKQSKFIAKVLRHDPESINLTIDDGGWASVKDLIANTRVPINMSELEHIIATDDKMRYSFSTDKKKIRANQGHSIDIKMDYKIQTPPNELYHGTKSKTMTIICKTGLDKMDRTHVHLSKDINTATTVANRRSGNSVIITINTKRMVEDGYEFRVSENGVWLIESVPMKYFKQINHI